MKMEKVACCYKCGTKKYKVKLKDGITSSYGVCPFCLQNTFLIPAIDWEGYGD